MNRTYKYRLYPTRNQVKILNTTLDLCRDLYNAGLQERIEAYKKCNIGLNYNFQQNELPILKEGSPQYEFIYAQVLQDVLHRLDKSFKNFFRKVKSKQGKAGFPRFKHRDRYNSFTYPQGGFGITDQNGLHLSKIGDIKIKMSRALPDIIKTCTIKQEIDKWYVCFSVEVDPIRRIVPHKSVGIDVGLNVFATLSNGTVFENPKYLKESEDKLAREQRRLSKKVKGGNNSRKQKFIVAKVHRKIKDQRNDYIHQVSRKIVNNHDFVAVEDLNIKGMVRNHKLAKSISDVSWNSLFDKLSYKAEEAGTMFVKVNKFYPSSQIHFECGYQNKDLKLSDRAWTCPNCGKLVNRDLNASRNIELEGLRQEGIINRVRNTRIYACGEIGLQDYSVKQEYGQSSALPNT